MIYTIILSIGVLVLFIKYFSLKKSMIEECIKEKGILLPNYKQSPNFIEVDQDRQLLKDIIESIKIESWKEDIKYNVDCYT